MKNETNTEPMQSVENKTIMKQTAVEWLRDNLHTHRDPFGKAQEMFEKQIVDAYSQGSLDTYKKEPKNGQGTKYYNETYKN